MNRDRLVEIRDLAHEGMECCDEPQFSILSSIVGKANELLSKEKQEAPAGLVEELEKQITHMHQMIGEAGLLNRIALFQELTRKLLDTAARYRHAPKEVKPTANADLVGELSELVCIDCDGAQADCGGDGNESPCDGCRIIQNAKREAKKILSKHRGAK